MLEHAQTSLLPLPDKKWRERREVRWKACVYTHTLICGRTPGNVLSHGLPWQRPLTKVSLQNGSRLSQIPFNKIRHFNMIKGSNAISIVFIYNSISFNEKGPSVRYCGVLNRFSPKVLLGLKSEKFPSRRLPSLFDIQYGACLPIWPLGKKIGFFTGQDRRI